MNGFGCVKDVRKAIEFYKKGAELGDKTAQYALGLEYYHGEHVHKDKKLAEEYLKKSAKHGLKEAKDALIDLDWS